MRISTKGRFAVNAMIDLALREQAGPVALASISQRQDISLSYLEQLFGRMRRLGLVESTRGPGGGYRLGRGISTISVADIVQAVDDPLEEQADELRSMGMSRALWLRLQATMMEHMAGVSLESLVEEQVASGMTKAAPEPRRIVTPQPVAKLRRPMAPNSVFAFGRSFASA
jgi:Rrf2 family transcriptional regulator, iron-sulfur cluster assembly transcription factor